MLLSYPSYVYSLPSSYLFLTLTLLYFGHRYLNLALTHFLFMEGDHNSPKVEMSEVICKADSYSVLPMEIWLMVIGIGSVIIGLVADKFTMIALYGSEV